MVEITDEMVERAAPFLRMTVKGYAFQRHGAGDYQESHDPHPDQIRRALTAALNPPADAEPPLPAAQIEAGWQEFVNSSYRDSVEGKQIVARIYRVMKSMEPRTPRERVLRAVMTQATDERVGAADRRDAMRDTKDIPLAPWELRGDAGRTIGASDRRQNR